MTGPAVPPGGEELQREIAQALHDADPRGWMYLAGVVLALPAVQAALAAQEKVRWVEELVADMETAPRGEIMPVSGAAALIRSVIEGQP